MSKPTKKTLRALTKENATDEEFESALEELGTSSDRMVAIVLAVHVQEALARLILAHLKHTDEGTLERLYERDGPLATFYSQIHLGYAMGLFDENVRGDLDAIRRVRNAFAHALKPITFHISEVAREIRKIKSPQAMEGARQGQPRTRFMDANANLAIFLYRRTTDKHNKVAHSLRRKMRMRERGKNHVSTATRRKP